MRKDQKTVIKLGVTGGIGSGKTSACRVFSALGIAVFSADAIAGEIMENDQSIISRINSIVKRDLYTSGNLDRKELASLIFNDYSLLEKVNSLIHPVVMDHFIKWVKEQSSPYVIMEAAILFESGASKLVDRIATLIAPMEQRVDRVIHRSHLTRAQVLERMRNQMNDDIRINLSDYVIYNSENDMIIPAILDIHKDILKLI